MRLGFFTAFGFKAWHRALAIVLLAGFCQFAPAQVSDGEGLTPLEGVLPITDDRALWDAVKDSRDVSDFKAYLNKFPSGLFAELASNRMRALTVGTAQPPVAQSPSAYPTITRPIATAPVQAGAVVKDCADCPEMVVIPAGSFEMGSNESADEQPVHRVNVPSFLIGKTEVTQGQWKAVMGSNPSRFSQCGDDCPVDSVSWSDAQEFAQRLSQRTSKQYRLPTEAEWEYAARAGSNAKWSFGDNENQLGDHAWYLGNSKVWFGENKSQRVAQKRPNGFGLFDMHGNVLEWVEDCWHGNYSGAPADGIGWTTACSGGYRVLRGGSWNYNPANLRSADRFRNSPDNRFYFNGLRLARALLTP